MKVRSTASSGRRRRPRYKKPKKDEKSGQLKITVPAGTRPEKPGMTITAPGRNPGPAGKAERKGPSVKREPKTAQTTNEKPEKKNGQEISKPQAPVAAAKNGKRKTAMTYAKSGSTGSKETKTGKLKARLEAYRKVSYVKPEFTLWLDDGRIVRNLKGLSRALKNMDVRVFAEHQQKKDISYWIRDAIGNAGLAAEFSSAKNGKDAVRVLQKFAREEKTKRAVKKQGKESVVEGPDRKDEKDDVTDTESEQNEFLEIQKAIKKIAAIPRQKKSRLSLEEREKMLMEKERILEEEEKRINKKRVEAARKRHRILEQREILEKEKFEEAIKLEKTAKKHGRNTEGLPKLKVDLQYTENMITQLLDQARKELVNENPETAVQLLEDIKKAISIAGVTSGPYSRKLEYEIMALEVDIKLAYLHQPRH